VYRPCRDGVANGNQANGIFLEKPYRRLDTNFAPLSPQPIILSFISMESIFPAGAFTVQRNKKSILQKFAVEPSVTPHVKLSQNECDYH
jgi:hypothetical protein